MVTPEGVAWRVVGASVPGTLHVDGGRGCDDAHGWRIAPDLSVVITADGAGSRPGTSALGAHVAVAGVLNASIQPGFAGFFEHLPEAAVNLLFHASLRRVVLCAANFGCPPGVFATTLSIGVIGQRTTVVAQIGDGIAMLERTDGTIEAVAVADHFEYANEVVFLTTDRAIRDHLKIACRPTAEVRGLALTTDGLRYKVLDNLQQTTPFEQFYRDAWAYTRGPDAVSHALEAFLTTVDDQTGDDKTLVIAVRDFLGGVAEPRRSQLSDRPPTPEGLVALPLPPPPPPPSPPPSGPIGSPPSPPFEVVTAGISRPER